MSKIIKSDKEWQLELTPEQFRVTRKSGTERAGSSPLNDEKRDGKYHCVCCQKPLFDAATKFDSGTGWPSFFDPISQSAIVEKSDHSFFRKRTEIICANCEAHLGHVFDDGPKPSGLRYCMNGAALNFNAANQE